MTWTLSSAQSLRNIMDFLLTKKLASLLSKRKDMKTAKMPAVEMSLSLVSEISILCWLSQEIWNLPYLVTWEAGILTAKDLREKKLKAKGKRRLHVDKQQGQCEPWPRQALNLREEIHSLAGGISPGPLFSESSLQILSRENGRSALSDSFRFYIQIALKNIKQLTLLFSCLPNGPPFREIIGGRPRKQQALDKCFDEWVKWMNVWGSEWKTQKLPSPNL